MARVRVCAPRTLLPAAIGDWPVEVFSDLDKAARDVDAIMALVQSASLPTQQQVITQLGEMSTALVSSGLGSPCVFVIGQVVKQAAASQVGCGAWLGEMEFRRAVGV